MTGGQQNPGSGKSIVGRDAPMVDIPALCRALGIRRVVEVDPLDLEQTERVLKAELEAGEPAVVIATSPCVLIYKIRRDPWSVDQDICTGCKVCLRAGCTALTLLPEQDGKRKVEIDTSQCNGCGVCAQLCTFHAIGQAGPESPADGPLKPVGGKDAS